MKRFFLTSSVICLLLINSSYTVKAVPVGNMQPTSNAVSYSVIADRVIQIIADKLNVDKSVIRRDSNFAKDLGVDSSEMLDLIIAFEYEFNVAIPDDVADKMLTVGDAISYLEKNVR